MKKLRSKYFVGACCALILFVFVAKSAVADSVDSAMKIETVDSADLKTTNKVEKLQAETQYQEDDRRPDHISKYGSFKLIEWPIEAAGKGLDGLVWGVQKVGSGIISIFEWPFKSRQKKQSAGDSNAKK